MAISIGLGYAAGYSFLTTILTLSILLMIYLWLSNKSITNKDEYNIAINWTNNEVSFEAIIETVMSLSETLKLIKSK